MRERTERFVNACVRKEENSHIHAPSFYPRNWERVSAVTRSHWKTGKSKEQKSMKLKTRNQLRKSSETKSWFFEKTINTIDKPLMRLIKMRERTDCQYQGRNTRSSPLRPHHQPCGPCRVTGDTPKDSTLVGLTTQKKRAGFGAHRLPKLKMHQTAQVSLKPLRS